MLEDPDPVIRETALNALKAIRKHHDEIEKWKHWAEEKTGK
jgi:hypothetical protein